MLAAWLVIYAVGNLVLIADSGLQFRAINRFLAFKSSVDCDGRTARFYAAMLRIYLGLAGSLVVLLLVGTQLLSPSAVLGFQAISNFDTAFVVMTAGMLLTLPSGLVSGLYRARGLYGRAVRLQNWGHAGRAARSTGRDRRDRKPVGRHHCVCGDAGAHRGLFSGDRCSPPVSVFARGAREAFVALDYRPVSQGGSVCGCGCHGAGVAQSAGAAGQRSCVRSRGRGAMGPHPRRRGTAAVALRSDHASAWLPSLATIMPSD